VIRLHLRARGVPLYVAGLLVVTLLTTAALQHPAEAARLSVITLAPLLATLLLGPTLAGADEALERGTPTPWPLIRTGHLAAAVIVTASLLNLPGGDDALVRNTLGCVGLVAGAAALIGVRLAWLPVFAYVCAVYASAPALDDRWAQIWAWPVQPSTAHLSWWPALAAFTVGAGVYILRGARTT
jgi:hypothetical protein